MMHEKTGAAVTAAPASDFLPDSADPDRRHFPKARRPALRKPVLLALLLLTSGVVVWGVPRHPAYLEWRYSRMTLPQLEKARAGRLDDTRLLYHVGRRLNAAGRFAESAPLLQTAAERDPDSPRLRDEWARALLGAGQISAAFGQLRQFAGTHPNLPEAHFILGKFYFAQSSMERAAEEMNKTIALTPDRAQAYSYLAKAHDALGNPAAAQQAVEKAIRLRPNHSLDRLLLASLLEHGNQPVAAQREYEQAVTLAPKAAITHREYASFLMNRGEQGAVNRNLAENEARTAAQLDSTDAKAYYLWGQALTANGKYAEAIEPLAKAATLDDRDPAAPKALASALRRLKRTDEAKKWQRVFAERQPDAARYKMLYEQIRVRPRDADLHRQMSRLLAKRGDVESSVRHQAAALRRAPDSPVVLAAAAGDLAAGGHPEDALPLAKRAVELGASSPATYEALGDVYLALGRAYQAGVEYHTAASLLPSRQAALRKKLEDFTARREADPPPAEVTFQKARRLHAQTIGPKPVTDEVLALAQKAVALEPHNPEYLWYLMDLQIARRKNDAAIATGERLLSEAPKLGKVHATLALLLTEKASDAADEARIEEHLKQAEGVADAAATYHYAKGLLYLKRKQGSEAAQELRQAAQLDPEPSVTYYKLAQAETMAGNAAAAQRAMTLFNALQKDKSAQANALTRVSEHPDDPEAYAAAARLFAAHGQTKQADAIRAEAKRRFARSK